MHKILIGLVVLTTLISACTSEPTKTENRGSVEEAKLNAIVNEATLSFLQSDPSLSTMLSVTESQAGGKYNHRFPDYSPIGMADLQIAMQQASVKVKTVNSDILSDKALLHKKVVANILDYYTGDMNFSAGFIDSWAGHLPYIVNQISGPLIDLPKLMQEQQPVSNMSQAQDYLSRLAGFKKLVNEVLAKRDADQQSGIVLPAKLHSKTLGYFENFLSPEPSQHNLISTFVTKLAATNIAQDTQQELIDQAIELVKTVVYPSFQKAYRSVQASQSIAKNEDGIWSQPKGAEFYQHAVKYFGDSVFDAQQIHQIGLDEVARISTLMDQILSRNGKRIGSVGERVIALSEDPKYLYENSDVGRQVLLAELREQVATIMAVAPDYFNELPSQKIQVKRISPVTEDGEAFGFYTPPSLDGKRDGVYWINLKDMASIPNFILKTLTYHEAVPGHHFQIALNMLQQDIGILRQNAPFNAYVEGWALYSELLAEEMGMYENDPWGDLGRLQAELYRAVRLVVDTGLHHKKWTREQAIDYFYSTTGTALSTVESEVERYMAWPGQALGYKLGMLQFVELRELARNSLGNQFDISKFHDVILLSGARPMVVVREDINRWIKDQTIKNNEETR